MTDSEKPGANVIKVFTAVSHEFVISGKLSQPSLLFAGARAYPRGENLKGAAQEQML